MSTYVSIIYFNHIQDIFQPVNRPNPIFSGYSLVNVFNCLLSSYPSLPPYVVVPGSANFLQGVLEQAWSAASGLLLGRLFLTPICCGRRKSGFPQVALEPG